MDSQIEIEERWQWFIAQEEKNRDTIVVRKEYVDITQDLNAGILLSQIIYWLLPSKHEKIGTKLRISKDGKKWLAKRREDWWEEIRLSPKQYDRAIKILKELGIIDVNVFKFDGNPTTHIYVNKDTFLYKLQNTNKKEEKPISPKGNIDIDQRGITKLTKGELPLTETTNIDYRQVKSKDFTTEIENDFGETEKTNGLLEPNKPLVSNSALIRSMAKSLEPKKYNCPKTIKPYIDYWIEKTGKKYRKDTTYKADCLTLKDAVLGKLLNEKNTPAVDPKYYGCKLALDVWQTAVDRFALMRNNADYFPKNKKNILHISVKSFFYNGWSEIGSKSYFMHCLENKPTLLTQLSKQKRAESTIASDPNPTATNILIDRCTSVFDWDFTNGNRSLAVQAVQKLNTFFENEKPKLMHFDLFYGDFNRRAGVLVKMLEAYESPERPAQPSYLVSDLTYTRFLPEYLRETDSYL